MRDQAILSIIDEFQNNIFNGKSTAIPETFAALSVGLESICQFIPGRHELKFRQTLVTLVQAYGNKDYLLLADILEYELKPLLMTSLNGVEQDGSM